MRARLFPILLLTLLAACASSFNARVARFQAMPAPTGQTFFVQPRDARMAGSLEFAQYANLVRSQLAAQGYQPAASPEAASLIVSLDYGISGGREKVVTRPSPFGFYGGYGRFGYWPYGRFGHFPFWGSAFYDPFWGGPFDYPEVYSYPVYDSFLQMRITPKGSSQSVFEGRAEATTRTDDLTRLVPNLVTAMFTNFPGRSGETVRISVPQERRSS